MVGSIAQCLPAVVKAGQDDSGAQREPEGSASEAAEAPRAVRGGTPSLPVRAPGSDRLPRQWKILSKYFICLVHHSILSAQRSVWNILAARPIFVKFMLSTLDKLKFSIIFWCHFPFKCILKSSCKKLLYTVPILFKIVAHTLLFSVNSFFFFFLIHLKGSLCGLNIVQACEKSTA